MKEMEVDIIGLSEINRNWRHISQRHRLKERTRGWWKTPTLISHITTKTARRQQSNPAEI